LRCDEKARKYGRGPGDSVASNSMAVEDICIPLAIICVVYDVSMIVVTDWD